MAEAHDARTHRPTSLLDGYTVESGTYDEMCASSGELRPRWQELITALDDMGVEELEQRRHDLQRLLQENGVTYNVYDDPRNAQRPWQVDPIPMIIDQNEWQKVAIGLQQRARLLNGLLADLYGSRTVIRRGIVPPELIYSDPSFRHACHNGLPAGQRWLIGYAADLARAFDGTLWVLGDRTQSPSGAGYALENRIIMARAFPNLYREAPLRRLASFLEAERSTLASLAQHNQDQPHVVLLSPGPGNASYFEHAYLANYWSLTLVEGDDLVVRDSRVWLKTLGGLRAVDVILRRLNDGFCDPLELRSDSMLGVPGLLHAVRSGNVALVNAIGSGIAENPGLLAFMPMLCRYFLGEDLRLPSIRTWWCGHRQDLRYVVDHFDDVMVRPIVPRQTPWLGRELDRASKASLLRRIRATPHLFIAQEHAMLSTAPTLENRRLVARPVLIRGFAVAYQDDYRVMPGALVRVSPGLDDLRTSIQKGGISKDLWVVADTPEKHVTLLRQAHGPIVVTRDTHDLPSRVADNLYWLGRYSERLDNRVRLLRETLGLFLQQERENAENSCLDDLLKALNIVPPTAASTRQSRFFGLRRELLSLFTDPDKVGSLLFIFNGMLKTGRMVRDHLGEDSWRLLNRLQRLIQQVPPALTAREARELLEQDLTLLAAFSGLTNDTMPHHYGWCFLDIGRQLERVLFTLDLFELAFITAEHPGVPLWEVVLNTTDNLTAYRRRYRSQLHPIAIIDLLLFDECNPRSVGYQLHHLNAQINRLPKKKNTPYRSTEQRLILEALSTLQLANIEALSDLSNRDAFNQELGYLLKALKPPLMALSNAITHIYFSHAEVAPQLVRME